MQIYVNDKELTVAEDCSVEKLLKLKELKCRASVWINGEQILLRDYGVRILKYQDRVKILRILGGG